MSVIQKCLNESYSKYIIPGILNYLGTRNISVTNFKSISSKDVIIKEKKYHANNYEPVPIVISRGQGNVPYLI